jgi:hypothetical protein
MKLAALFLAGVVATTPLAPAADKSSTSSDAIAVEAYLYLYPLVVMDYTRRQLINVPPGKPGIAAPMNTFAADPAFPTPEMHSVPRPNFDTLYSPAWVDLTAGPVLITTPDTDGRYYLASILDMWSEVFASLGKRTTGTEAGHFLLTPPRWKGSMPEGLPQGTVVLPAPTHYVWVIGRLQTDGEADFPAVHALQKGFTLTAYDASGAEKKPAPFVAKREIDMKTPPNLQVEAMSAVEFFATAAELMKLHPPHLIDSPIVQRMTRVGIVAGKSFDPSSQSGEVIAALNAAPKAAKELMIWKFPRIGEQVNQWSMNTECVGTYGSSYVKRAVIARFGLGSNVPQDSIYPLAFNDADGKPLDGNNSYVLHFDAANLPPVEAFWSLTLYDADGFPVANVLNRYAVSSWMPLAYNADGSLDLYIQSESPGKAKEANWLPCQKAPFGLNMRLYAPSLDAVAGKWHPAAVRRVRSEKPQESKR